jgi:hypothetical protein
MPIYFLFLQAHMYFNSLKPHFIMRISNGVYIMQKLTGRMFSGINFVKPV